MKRAFIISYKVIVHLLAAAALFLMFTALAVKMKWTHDVGDVDINNRYFDKVSAKSDKDLDSSQQQALRVRIYQKIGVLSNKYPKNAEIILSAYLKTNDVKIADRMLDAVRIFLKKDKSVQKAFKKIDNSYSKQSTSLYPWAHSQAWEDFCTSVSRDKAAIDSVSRITGVESRLIVMCLVGEQVRMFNSGREKFKQYVMPFNRLMMPTNRGYGVTGILQHTALRIESNVFNKNSDFYAGDYFQNCINVNDSFPDVVDASIESHKLKTIQRLIKGGDHYYSYLYTAFLIRQYQAHWEKAGFTLAFRPEIIATLFNLGFHKSKPSKHPKVGGSNFNVAEREYTFGGLCYEFYYSGELMDNFPLTSEPITPVEKLIARNPELIKRKQEEIKGLAIEETN